MKPLDPRLLPHLTPARRPLVGVVAASTASGLLLVGQAFAVAGLVTSSSQVPREAGRGTPRSPPVWCSARDAGPGLASWLVDALPPAPRRR